MIQLRIEPQLKAAAKKAASLEHRNLTNWIEVLILDRCKSLNVDTTTAPDAQEDVNEKNQQATDAATGITGETSPGGDPVLPGK